MDWRHHDKNIYDNVKSWFEAIGEELRKPDVLLENVYNIDETGIMLSMQASAKVLVGQDDRRDYKGAHVNRTTVTAIECVSASGEVLKPMIIWPAVTHRSNWTTYPTPRWHYSVSDTGYNDSEISFKWLTRVFDPQTKARANQKPRLLICDGFSTHETEDMVKFCFENNILICILPSHTSHKLQPCDVALFAPLKDAYRDQADRLERGGTNTIGKEHFTSLYSRARDRAITKKNVLAGFAKAGLYPFNPERVLRDIKKPAVLTIANAEADLVPSLQGDVVPVLSTPKTPVTSQALTSLRNQILNTVKQPVLDEKSRHYLVKQIEKYDHAAQISFAERVLQKGQMYQMAKLNDEAKVRRSTKSLILGKAKIMRYEDLVEKRAAREAKEQAKANGKGRRGRKRKKTDEPEPAVPEPGVPEPDVTEPNVSEPTRESGRKRKSTAPPTDLPVPKTKVARTSGPQVMEPKAPVAWMSEAQNEIPLGSD